MTEIEFHANVADKLQFGCRLLRKVVRSGARAIVIADPQTLKDLDKALWVFSATEFLPHCTASAPDAVLAATPVLLVEQLEPQARQLPPAVLINLGQLVPAMFEQFERLIEIASVDPDDRQAALARWKHYKERGYNLKRHEAVAGAAA